MISPSPPKDPNKVTVTKTQLACKESRLMWSNMYIDKYP